MPQLLVHGWWNLGGAKMSKSAGNIVDPFVLIDKYGAEALRYYLMSDIVDRQGRGFSEEQLISCVTTDLGKLRSVISLQSTHCNDDLDHFAKRQANSD